MCPASTLEVNLAAVRHNVRRLHKLCTDTQHPLAPPFHGVCATIKADGYGLGAVRVARALRDLVHSFALYTPDEAAELLAAIPNIKPLLVMMPQHEIPGASEIREAMNAGRVQFVIHSLTQLNSLLSSAAATGIAAPLALHVQIDTGMSRGGCSLKEFPEILSTLASNEGAAKLVGLLTHMASADADPAFTHTQYQRFMGAVRENIVANVEPDPDSDEPEAWRKNGPLLHVANTFSVLRSPAYHESMIRPGIGLIGYGPEMMTGGAPLFPAGELRPALRWVSRIVHLKTIQPAISVGYNLRWMARRESIIGLVPVGYADGYPTQADPAMAANRAVAVLLKGSGGTVCRAYVPVVGAVNMDQITIDLTDAAREAASSGATLAAGTEVELITPDHTAANHAPTLARASRISAYELATGIGRRVTRIYRD